MPNNPYTIFDPQIGLDAWMSKSGIDFSNQNAAGLSDGILGSSDSLPDSTIGGTGLLTNTIADPLLPTDIVPGELGALIGHGKKTFTDTTAGYLMGLDKDGTYKWIIGNSTNSVDWNVTTPGVLTIVGSITATTGTIGGWTIGTTTLTATGVTLSSAGNASIAFGTTPPTSPTVGTGIYIDKTGLFGLSANTQNFAISATDGSITSIKGTVAGFTVAATSFSIVNGGNTTTMSSGATSFLSGPTGSPTFSVTQAGVLTSTSGVIGAWNITSTVLRSGASDAASNVLLDPTNSVLRLGPTSGNYLNLDGANLRIRSSNYVTGVNGAGFTLEPNLLEVGNIAARGLIRSTVFQKDIISAVAGGHLVVPNSDVLATDMTALHTSTSLTTKGTTTFAVGDKLRIKDGTNDEWMEVISAASAPTYTVIRDSKNSYFTNQLQYLNCESTASWGDILSLDSTTRTIDTANYKEGSGSLSCLVSTASTGNNQVAIQYNGQANLNISAYSAGKFTFWFYIDAVGFAGLTATRVAFFTTSTSNYIQWRGSFYSQVVQSGWNYIELDCASPDALDGSFSFSDFDFIWFETYHTAGTADYTFKLDNIRFIAGLNNNPAWTKGATVLDYGLTGQGGVYSTASEANAPYVSVFTHAGAPWTTITERVRIGNLNGLAAFVSPTYGIFIGNYATGKYLTYDDASGNLNVNGYVQTNIGAFGGDGTDGALSVTSGTTTLSAASANLLVKNYTSISISGGATLTLSNKAAAGTILYLKCQGDVTIAGTIEMSSMGANSATTGFAVVDDAAHFGGTGGAGGSGTPAVGTAGAIYTNKAFYTTPNASLLHRKFIILSCGSGGGIGGVGGNGGGAGGAGGVGGGVVIIECKGALNFTGTINVNGGTGVNGSNATGSTQQGGGGGGGGGAAGMAFLLWNTLTSAAGTINAKGAAGGIGGTGGQGGGGYSGGAGGGGGGNYTVAGQVGGASHPAAAGDNGPNATFGEGAGGGGGGSSNSGGQQVGGNGGTQGANDTNNSLVTQNKYFA